MALNDEIIKMLKREDCNIVGFADLCCLSADVRQKFDYGILIALSYSKEAMRENKNGSPQKYYEELTAMNNRLNELAVLTADYLVNQGFKAWAKTQSTIVQNRVFCTVLPHKTVATLAGIGWIGKCAMLVTKEVGSALRITAVLTNAPFDCGAPVTKSLCGGSCKICSDICPGKAPIGDLWETDIDRDDFFNARACFRAARARAKETLGIDETVCGLCMSNCPFTKSGLGYE